MRMAGDSRRATTGDDQIDFRSFSRQRVEASPYAVYADTHSTLSVLTFAIVTLMLIASMQDCGTSGLARQRALAAAASASLDAPACFARMYASIITSAFRHSGSVALAGRRAV